MRRMCLVLAAVAVGVSVPAGCRRDLQVELRSMPGPEQGQQVPGTWEALTPAPVTDPRRKPRFLSAEEAKQSPTLTLTTFEGERLKVRPGQEGKVTLVVFWSMALPVTRAAARHVSDLVDKYGRLGATAIGVVERNTLGSELAPEFMLRERIGYPVYYDNFRALRVMARAAGARARRELPCFFLVDRHMRVRMFKRGFAFAGTLAAWPRTGRERVEEQAAPGERIEDFLCRLLEEQ